MFPEIELVEPALEQRIGAQGALAFLQAVYRNQEIPLSVRMRAAIEALPFETPKLSATALVPMGGDFAKRLEKAIERSREGSRLIEHTSASTDDHRPVSPLPDQQFRRA